VDTADEDEHMKITIDVPDIQSFSDEDLENFVFRQDGRWSKQTKALMLKHRASGLDLNSQWAAVSPHWCCPTCKRHKTEIARLSVGGTLICCLERHHDHLVDEVQRIFWGINPQTADYEKRVDLIRFSDRLWPFIQRFTTALICRDCNQADAKAKALLGAAVCKGFSFSPSEIGEFIEPSSCAAHAINEGRAFEIWEQVKDDVMDRFKFAQTMAKRASEGRNRLSVNLDESSKSSDERDIIFSLVTAAAPRNFRFKVADDILYRSTAFSSAGKGQKPRRSDSIFVPTDAEFAEIDAKQSEKRVWKHAGIDWRCASCYRSKREICRKSNTGTWTASISEISVYEMEHDVDSLARRAADGSAYVLSARHRETVCHDCRNVIGELKRRNPGLREDALQLGDLRHLASEAEPHRPLTVNFDLAAEMAMRNVEWLRAIDNFELHRFDAYEFSKQLRQLQFASSCSQSEAMILAADKYATDHSVSPQHARAHVEWLKREYDRLYTLGNSWRTSGFRSDN
jgi:hypothetical protein